MDDMRMVRELMPDTSLRSLDELAAARSTLDEAMGGGKPAARRRFAPAIWTTAALAAAIAAVVVLAPDTVGGPTSEAEAAQVLRDAAAATLTLPDVEPRGNQFVYQRSGDGAETWLSVDGTRDGLVQRADGTDKGVLPGCRDGKRAVMKGDEVIGSESCTPEPAYNPDLPTDPDAMFAYLNPNGDANSMGKDILYLMNGRYVRPQSRAALFEAAARIPGLRVVRDGLDPADRPAIQVMWSTDGKSGGIFFDPDTLAYLGVWAGKGSSAVLRVAIVDTVGQRP
ncbi:hypothetical protein SAMN05421812_10742 [Asanoa hainanensis]|uniref:Uncharacterized protein n=1 Tax=Asanoa hainanensis TaxID=560556 RepID=A0A239N0K3_9ACTN|nr:CU044_5270 family protein [Asanoa hainanensis]SNT47954.1 hypothetical protein SAMN05421812_10742 [Asanoa hainanensis]